MFKKRPKYLCDYCGWEIKSGDGVAYIPSLNKSEKGHMYHDSVFDTSSIDDECVYRSFKNSDASRLRELRKGTTFIYFWGNFYRMGTIWRKQEKLEVDPEFEKGTRFSNTFLNNLRLWRYLRIRERGIK